MIGVRVSLALLLALLVPRLPAQDISGSWQGTLKAGDANLRVIFEITGHPSSWTGRLFSIDQGPDPMPVDTITLDHNHLHLVASAIHGEYDGTLNADATTLTGTWTQGPPLPLVLVRATPTTRWSRDTSPHTASFVTVAPDVKLEVLDWGGTGRPVILLAGLGNSAHVFDKFAPKLTSTCHVFGITRRGFGDSSAPAPIPANYMADRLGDDVLAVIASLHLQKPVLIGHSIAGEELSSIASRHPEQVTGLVYLDAGFPYAFYDPARGDFNLDLIELRRRLDEFMPNPAAGDTSAPMAEVQRSLPQFERDLKQQQARAAVMPKPPKPAPYAALAPPTPSSALLAGEQKYTRIPVPALAIFAVPHQMDGMFPDDPKAQAAAETEDLAHMTDVADSFEHGVPTARVVRIPHANHYVFESNTDQVLREISTFLLTLH